MQKNHPLTTFEHEDANVYIEELSPSKNKIYIEPKSDDLYVHIAQCETSYPPELIEAILSVKGPGYLCDEILRDESPDYVQRSLKYDILSYIDEKEFNNKRLLDFGCGSGASTMVLARMFPNIEITGVELEEKLLSLARLRATHYGYNNLNLMISPDPASLPPDIGAFDYIIMSAVYEHLLPKERETVLQKLWNVLNDGGILFLNQTPYRYSLIETHTTGYLPLINYMPDTLALYYARHLSNRNMQNDDWQTLLRKGIRGGGVREIMSILNRCPGNPILLNPFRFGIRDRIDLWYTQSVTARFASLKKLYLLLTRLLKMLTGAEVVPHLSLAIKKTQI